MFFSRQDERAIAYARVQKVLRDMPWLWALQQTWNDTSSVEVEQVDDDGFMSLWTSRLDFAAGRFKSNLFLHIVTEDKEEVHYADHDGQNADGNMFNALDLMQDRGVDLESVRHLVIVLDGPDEGGKMKKEIRIFRAKSFKRLFYSSYTFWRKLDVVV